MDALRAGCAEEHDGISYAVLRNSGGILAVYAIGGTGRVRWATTWPETIEE